MRTAGHMETYHFTSIFKSEEGPGKKIVTKNILHSSLCSLDVICEGERMQEGVHFEKYTPNFE